MQMRPNAFLVGDENQAIAADPSSPIRSLPACLTVQTYILW